MTPEKLESLTKIAILEKQVHPFGRISPPVVQIWSDRELKNFPIPLIYVGQRFKRSEGKNGYIYNLCAYQVLQHLERYRQEFDL